LGGEEIAGGKLKETGSIHWAYPNEGATNESGFTAIPCGNRTTNGAFDFFERNCDWWSSSEASAEYAWGVGVSYYYSSMGRHDAYKKFGFSVRCVKD